MSIHVFPFRATVQTGRHPPLHRLGRDCFDNAVTESFFATLECELLDRCHFTTRAQAKAACFDFIEGFCNTRRRHSATGMLSPAVYERRQPQRQTFYSVAA